jgi:hypothetical protein
MERKDHVGHIALTKGEEELGSRVGDCVHRAVASALDPGEEGYLQIVTKQHPDLKVAPLQPEAGQTNVTAIVLIYPTEPISDRKKRILFGRIGEGLAQENLIEKKIWWSASSSNPIATGITAARP